MSEPRVINRNYFFAVIGIAGLTIITLALCGCQHGTTPPPGGGGGKGGGSNPPIVVNGGSVDALSAVDWSKPSPSAPPATVNTLSSVDATILSLYGVAQNGVGGPYLASVTNNWIVTLYFLDREGHDPIVSHETVKVLKICSDIGCDTNARPLGSTMQKATIFMAGDKWGNFTIADSLGGYGFDRYDLIEDDPCMQTTGGQQNTACNHLIRIGVDGVSQWSPAAATTTTGGTVTTMFDCPGGTCGVYVGGTGNMSVKAK